jgi:hypothetical protein
MWWINGAVSFVSGKLQSYVLQILLPCKYAIGARYVVNIILYLCRLCAILFILRRFRSTLTNQTCVPRVYSVWFSEGPQVIMKDIIRSCATSVFPGTFRTSSLKLCRHMQFSCITKNTLSAYILLRIINSISSEIQIMRLLLLCNFIT